MNIRIPRLGFSSLECPPLGQHLRFRDPFSPRSRNDCAASVLALILFCVAISGPAARAATYSWVGTTSANMSGVTTNWNPAGAPGSGDIAEWNAATYTNAPSANLAMSLGELWFAAGNTGALTFGGTQVLTLYGVSNTGIEMDNGSGAVSLGSVKLDIAGNQYWTNNSGNTLTIGGAITNNANTTPYTISFNGSGATTLSGAISNGGSTGTLSLAESSGTLTLSGANTFTGGVTLTAGTLDINSAGVAGTSGPLGNGDTFTINGGTIDNTSGSAKVLLNVNPITIGGSFGFSTSAGTSTANNLTLPGAVSMAASQTITLNGAGALTLSGTLTNTAANSAITLTVNNGNNTAATSILTLGAFNLTPSGATNAQTDSINGSGNVTITGTVADGGGTGSGLTYAGAGTLKLSGASTYTGVTTIENGTVVAGAAVPSGSVGPFGNSTSAIALGDATSIASNLSPSLLIAGAFNVGRAITVGASNGSTSGVYTIGGSSANASTFSNTITLNQGLTVSQVTGGTVNLTGNITSGASGTQTLTFNNAGSVSQTTGVIGGGTGTIAVIQSGAGTTTLSGANTFTGGLTINAGQVALGTATAAGTGAIALGNSTPGNSNNATLNFNAASDATYANNITVNAGSSGTLTFLSNSGNGGAIISGNVTLNNSLTFYDSALKTIAITGATTVGSGNIIVSTTNDMNLTISGGLTLGGGTLTLDNNNPGGITIGTGNITGSGGITNSGTGTGMTTISGTIGASVTGLTQNSTTSGLTLTTASNGGFMGDTTITSGSLDFQNVNSLQSSVVNLNGGTLYFGKSGNSFTSAALGGLAGSGNLNLNDINTTPDAVALTIGNSNTSNGSNTLNPTYSGNLSNTNGNASLTKVGSNTQTLSGANTYGGATSVNGGTLEFAAPAALYDGSTSFWTGAKIKVANGATLALGVGGAGQFTAGNVSSLFTGGIFNATNSSTGLQSGAAIGFDTTGGNFTQGSTIGAIGNSTGADGGAIGLTKLGSNTLTLDQANTYTGPTTVAAGTLIVTGSLSGSGAVNVTGGTLGGNGLINGAVTVASGATLYPGAALGLSSPQGTTLTLGSTVTFSGGSTFDVNLDNNGDTADELAITGGLNIGSNDTLTLNLLNTVPTANIFEIAAYTGSWNGIQFATVNGLPAGYQVDYTSDPGEILVDLAAVPEPQTWAILLGGFGMLLCLQRRRSRRNFSSEVA